MNRKYNQTGQPNAAGKRMSTGRSGPREEKLAAAKKATALRGAASRRSGGSTPRGGYAHGGKAKGGKADIASMEKACSTMAGKNNSVTY